MYVQPIPKYFWQNIIDKPCAKNMHRCEVIISIHLYIYPTCTEIHICIFNKDTNIIENLVLIYRLRIQTLSLDYQVLNTILYAKFTKTKRHPYIICCSICQTCKKETFFGQTCFVKFFKGNLWIMMMMLMMARVFLFVCFWEY